MYFKPSRIKTTLDSLEVMYAQAEAENGHGRVPVGLP